MAKTGDLKAKQPAPEFRVREISATALAKPGESLFMRMPPMEELIKQKGLFGRVKERRVSKRLYLLVECLEATPDRSEVPDRR